MSDVRQAVALMRELGILHLKQDGLELLLGPEPLKAVQDQAAPKLDGEKRGPDGLTPSEQEDLYGKKFENE